MILENCTNDALRLEAKDCLCHVYHRIAAKDPEGSAAEEAALEHIISEMPDLYHTKEYVSTFHIDPCKTVCQNSIIKTLEVLNGMITHLCGGFHEGGDNWDVVGLPLQYAKLDIYRAAFPHGDYGKMHGHILGSWQFIAHGHAQAGEFDEAFDALQQAVELSRRYDALPQVSEQTSPLFRGYIFEKDEQWGRLADNMRRFLLGEELTWTFYNPWPEGFKEDPRFAEILASLV